MKWNEYPNNYPKFSCPYLISAKMNLVGAEYFFRAIAYFNLEERSWFKWDPFKFKNEIGERIEIKVLAWKKIGPVYSE